MGKDDEGESRDEFQEDEVVDVITIALVERDSRKPFVVDMIIHHNNGNRHQGQQCL